MEYGEIPHNAIGKVITPSKINNHLQPSKPPVPFMPLYSAACKYPLNMDPTNAEAKKIDARFASSRFVLRRTGSQLFLSRNVLGEHNNDSGAVRHFSSR
jgi:hypothetical protein